MKTDIPKRGNTVLIYFEKPFKYAAIIFYFIGTLTLVKIILFTLTYFVSLFTQAGKIRQNSQTD